MSARNIPQESDCRGRSDDTSVDIPRSARDDTSYCQPDDDARILQERRAKQLCENDGNEGKKAEPDEFNGAPPKLLSMQRTKMKSSFPHGNACLDEVVGQTRRENGPLLGRF